jgi:hypothetical protein
MPNLEWLKLKEKMKNLFDTKLPVLLEDVIKSTAVFDPKKKKFEHWNEIIVNDTIIEQLIKFWMTGIQSKKNGHVATKETHLAKLTKSGWTYTLSFVEKKAKTEDMFCEKEEGKNYCHFSSHPKSVEMYGAKPNEIVKVRVSEDTSDDPKFFGWWDYQDQDFSMIYGHLSLVNICFAYGFFVEMERGRGEVCGLKAEEI